MPCTCGRESDEARRKGVQGIDVSSGDTTERHTHLTTQGVEHELTLCGEVALRPHAVEHANFLAVHKEAAAPEVPPRHPPGGNEVMHHGMWRVHDTVEAVPGDEPRPKIQVIEI